MEKKHLIAAFVALAGLTMAFVVGCSLASVPTAQQTPLLTTVLSFLAILATQIWVKADSDRKLSRVEQKLDTNTAITRRVADEDDPGGDDECDDLPPLPGLPTRNLPGELDP